jgi:hypothetical protein
MAKLILPDNIEFNDYKGFVIKVDQVEGTEIFAGVAINKGQGEAKTMFTALGKTRNEVGRELEKYVDIYRKSVKPKLTLN